MATPTLEVEEIDVKPCSPTVVTYSATSADNFPGVTAACSPSSGSEFPVGETEATCTSVSAVGSMTQESFVVLVECDGGDGATARSPTETTETTA